MSRTHREKTEQKWRELNEIFTHSDETQKSFCESRGIGLASFQYWQGKFRKENKSGVFREVLREPLSGHYCIDFPSGRKLRLEGDFSDSQVRRLIEVLESC